MFDLDAGKLIIIGIVALVVIGPKELPRVMRQVGQAIGKLRRMAADFQGQFMDAMKEADIEDLKKEINAVAESTKAEVNAISDAARIDMNFDPVAELSLWRRSCSRMLKSGGQGFFARRKARRSGLLLCFQKAECDL